MTRRGTFVFSIATLLLGLATLLSLGAVTQADAQTPGYASKMPVCAGATKINPWGALCDIVATSVAPYGWNVQVCYNCAGGIKEVIDVETKLNTSTVTANPASLESDGIPLSIAELIDPPPPGGPVDFGVAAPNFIWWAYAGTQALGGGSATAAPYSDLRLVATIVKPLYLVVAATQSSGYTDLSQVAAAVAAGKPVHVLWDNGITSDAAQAVLAYYGMTSASIKAAGGAVTGNSAAAQADFDVIIYTADLSEAPEFNVLYIVTQTTPLTFIPLPTALLTQLEQTYDMVPFTAPIGFVKWMWQPYATVGFNGDAVFGRSDMPDQFAYDLAKGIDQRKDLLETGYEHWAYDPTQVWKAYGVPLAPGAAKYYAEQGYLTLTMPPQCNGSLAGCNLQNANLTGAFFVGANLSGSNLQGANLAGAQLTNANLSGANLQNSNLGGVNLSDATLRGANLQGAKLSNADLQGATWNGANVNGVTWSNTTCPNATNSNNDGNTCQGQPASK